MASKSKQKSVPRTLSRSEIVTIRLEPKLKHLAEISARKQRRTLSSFIEWSVEQSLENVFPKPATGKHLGDMTNMFDKLWAVDEGERFLRLAILYPELLNYEEQHLLQILFDSFFLMNACGRGYGGELIWDWEELESRVFPEIREEWPHFMMACADGNRQDINRWIEDMQRRQQAIMATIQMPTEDTPLKKKSTKLLPKKG